MLPNSWLRALTLVQGRSLSKRRRARFGAKSSRLARVVERLEDRTLLAMIIVTTEQDVLDGNTSSLSALTGSPGTDGQISLREAIIASNQTLGADTIQFAASLNSVPILLSRGGGSEDAGLTGDLDVTDNLTIAGNGSALTVIDAGPRLDVSSGLGDRVFHILGPRSTQSEIGSTTPINVTISGVTIKGGVAEQGGGILSENSRLIVDSSRIENNQAVGRNGVSRGNSGEGGGIFVGTLSTLRVQGTTFANNQARGGDAAAVNGFGGEGAGGAIFNNFGFVEILPAGPTMQSVFQGNRAIGGRVRDASGESGDGEGGAIFNQSGHVEIHEAVFNQNEAVGGGLLSDAMLGSGEGSGGAVSTVGISQLTTLIVEDSAFTNNRAMGAGTGDGGGGAIWAEDDMVTIVGSSFDMNKAIGGALGGDGLGGAVYMTATATRPNEIEDSMLTRNEARGGTNGHGQGGAIWSSGVSLEVFRDELSGNLAIGGGGTGAGPAGNGLGGGIYLANGTAFIRKTTIVLNQATGGDEDSGTGGQGRGGGVYNGDRSAANIDNSTFSANKANGGAGSTAGGDASGGGLYHAGTLIMSVNATFTLNEANVSTGGTGQGSGVAIGAGGSSMFVGNTVIAQNVSAGGSPDVFGAFSSQGGNFVGDGTGATGLTDPTDQVGTSGSPLNAMLGALGNNGGPTRTHLPLAGSLLIDTGKNSLVPPNPEGFGLLPPADQRDFQRIVDGDDADADAEVDIGATEVGALPLPFVEEDTDPEAVFQIVYDDGDGPTTVNMVGMLTFLTLFDGPNEGDANDSDGDGRDDVMTALANTSFLRSGAAPNGEIFLVQQSLTIPSLGQIEETTDTLTGRLDLPPFAPTGTAESVGDLYVIVSVQQPAGPPLLLHNNVPIRLRSTISFKPAGPGNTYTLINGPIPLLDNGNQTIATILDIQYTPIPVADFGDAPEGPFGGAYPTTLFRNGARHAQPDGSPRLGANVDSESNGNPTLNADGDDTIPAAAADDEDGVVFTSALTAGQTATVDVTASATAFLNAWVDFNGDGDWSDTGEQIFTNRALNAGVNSLSFAVPAGALGLSTAYSRFRISSGTGLSFDGFAPDGEVEDYAIAIQAPPRDFGDAPNPYPTGTLGFGAAAFHTIVSGFHLGATVDAEASGQPTTGADGDDVNPGAGPDDEDGVVFLTPLVAGQNATVRVTASQAGVLNAWLDYGGDGFWSSPNDQIFLNVPLAAGANDLNLAVPIVGFELATDTFARFRFSSLNDLTPDGGAIDGEVEDYRVQITSFDFGDAPNSYGTTLNFDGLGTDGASHIRRGPRLGFFNDAEANGQPNATATLDDATNLDDEDGVFFTPLVTGFLSRVTVFASAAGFVNAWFDFNIDGDFLDTGERFLADRPVSLGNNLLSFLVPSGLSEGTTFARFRITSTAEGEVASPHGQRPDGEVEDYGLRIDGFSLPDDPSARETYVFTVLQPVRRFYDPAIAIGYDFVASGQNFKTVTLPSLAQGDNLYTLHLDNGSGGYLTTAAATLAAGIEYDFTLGFVDALGSAIGAVPAGLTRFRILGIETSAAVDPANPTGFVTGLSFVAGGGSFTMTGIAERVYVDNSADFVITTNQGAAGLDNGDTVTWQGRSGTADDVTGLIFGTTAFSSVQAAITNVESNNTSALTTIKIAPGTFVENLTVSGTTLEGSGAGETFLDGNATGRVIDVTATAVATISGVTIQNGSAGTGTGGGIRNAGTLTITNGLIRNNASGAINNPAGGGIFNSNSGTLTITNSTIANNTAFNGHGAGLANTGTVTITNSTVSGNQSGMDGGGIFNAAGGVLTIQNSTVTRNVADVNGDTLGDGGGIFAAGTETLTSTIVAGNGKAFVSTPNDIFGGTINTASRNLIGDAGTAGGIAHGTNGNIVGNAGSGTININTVLNTTLDNNGGPTPNHALVSGSPAIDAGTNATGTAVDQRGFARTTDVATVANAAGSDATDIGSFEVSPVVINSGGSGSNLTVRFNSSTGQLEVLDNSTGGTVVANSPPGGTSGIVIAGGAGDDLLTIDFTNGNPIPAGGLTFNAGGQATSSGDSLTITGGSFSTVSYNTAPGGAGTLMLGASTITFTGLEPVTVMSTAATVTINIDDANGTANESLTTQITNGGTAGDGQLFLDAPGTAEDMTFAMPTTSLVINGDNDDNDAITIVSLDTGFGAAITINGQGGNDTLTVNNVTLTRTISLAGGTGTNTATVSGVSVSGSTGDGLNGSGFSSVNVSTSTFNDNTGEGIDLSSVGNVVFNSVTATGNGAGVLVNGATAFFDTNGNFSNNDDHGIQLIDIFGSVSLVRTTADNNDADNDGVGDGLNATDGADGDSVAIAANLQVQGARFRDTGGINDHQQNGVFVASIVGVIIGTRFENSGPQTVLVTGNEANGVRIDDGGTFVAFTNGNYSNNGLDGIRLAATTTVDVTNVAFSNNGSGMSGSFTTVGTLNFTHGAGASADVITLTSTQIQPTGQQPSAYATVTNLTLNTGDGADTITVNSTAAGTTYMINPGPGDDLTRIGAPGATSATTISEGGGTDAIELLPGSTLNTPGGVMVPSGDTLKGTGLVMSGLNVNGLGGRLSPGATPGQITVNGVVTFFLDSFFDVELNGTTAVTQYDQLVVTGALSSVVLAGPSLNASLLPSFVPALGTRFTIIDNQSSSQVFFNFTGLADNATFLVGSTRFRIDYDGGDGNDVVLTVVETDVQQTRFLRMYNRNADLHFFTTSLAEFLAVQAFGYEDEATGRGGFNVTTNNPTGSVPLHRLYSPAGGQHYYTRNSAERDILVSLGWRYERDEGQVFPTQAAGTVEIFRLYNRIGGGHLFTESVGIRDAVLSVPGWELHSNLGFAFASGSFSPPSGGPARRAVSSVETADAQRTEGEVSAFGVATGWSSTSFGMGDAAASRLPGWLSADTSSSGRLAEAASASIKGVSPVGLPTPPPRRMPTVSSSPDTELVDALWGELAQQPVGSLAWDDLWD